MKSVIILCLSILKNVCFLRKHSPKITILSSLYCVIYNIISRRFVMKLNLLSGSIHIHYNAKMVL